MLKFSYLLAALALAAGPVAAQPGAPAGTGKINGPGQPARTPAAPTAPDWSGSYAASITPAGLRADLTVLASDAYEGRDTGKPGQQLAADYLSKAFAADGLRGPVPNSDNPYYQHFTVNRVALDPASSVQVGGRTFVVNRDFHLLLRDATTTAGVVQPTFVGYGISTAGYANFAPGAASLQNGYLLLLLGEPLTPAGPPLLGAGGQPSAYGRAGFDEMGARSPAVRALNARATFRIAPSAAAFARAPRDYAPMFDYPEQFVFPGESVAQQQGSRTNVFIVSPAMGAALLGTTAAGLAQYEQAVARAGKPIASPFRPGPVTLRVQEKTAPLPTENVLGYLEGSDKKDEVLIISAHYDHLGVKDGVVFNGADDDGSGTASVLALARAFSQAKKDGHGPRRSILFLANTGEEKGLLGSKYYVGHPVFPLENTVADLHIDMLGRVDSLHRGQGDYVYVIGDDWRSSELRALSEATNAASQPLALDYTYNDFRQPDHLYRRSDHLSFAQRRVPVIFYTSGLHPDYHRPTDDVERIDFAALARRSQLVFRTAWALANRDQRPALDADKLAPLGG